MTNQSTRQALAQDIKKEIMADLQNQRMMYPNTQQMNPAMVQAVKWDVIAQLEAEQQAGNQRISGHQQSGKHNDRSNTDRAMIDSIKRDVMAYINAGFNAYQTGVNAFHSGMTAYNQTMYPHAPNTQRYSYDPVLVETIKRQVIAQMGVEQEPAEAVEAGEGAQQTGQFHNRQSNQPYYVDPHLVETIKRDVMIEMQAQQRTVQ